MRRAWPGCSITKASEIIWVADDPGFVPRNVNALQSDDGQAIASVRWRRRKTLFYARGRETNKEGRRQSDTA